MIRKWLSYPLMIVSCKSIPRIRLVLMGLALLVFNLFTVVEYFFFHATRLSAVKKAGLQARATLKPMLNYGCGKTGYGHVNADIEVRDVPNFVLIEPSPRPTPFRDKSFGAAICSNVLEHVPDPEALRAELGRVSDKVYEVLPNPLFAWSWLHPEHLHIFIKGKSYRIRGQAPLLEML